MDSPDTGDMVFRGFRSVGAVVASSVGAGLVVLGAGWVAMAGTSTPSSITAGTSATVSSRETGSA